MQYDEGAEPAENGLRGAANVWSYSRKLKAALIAEFFGMMIFQIYGGNAPDSVAAFGNGITLVVLGGHPSIHLPKLSHESSLLRRYRTQPFSDLILI